MIIKPPTPLPVRGTANLVFLGGSIEMGQAVDWQTGTGDLLKQAGWTVLNPRRDNWNPDWAQTLDNPDFVGQVEWELEGLERSTWKLFYFNPGTKSPITLMELGLWARTRDPRIIVVCPDGFWRKGNVDMVCRKYGLRQCDTAYDAVQVIGKASNRKLWFKYPPDVEFETTFDQWFDHNFPMTEGTARVFQNFLREVTLKGWTEGFNRSQELRYEGWRDEELAAVEKLMSRMDMSETGILRHSLRWYQYRQAMYDQGYSTVKFFNDKGEAYEKLSKLYVGDDDHE